MDYTEVAQIESPFEAEVLKDALEAEGIHFIINSHWDTAFSGAFVEERGWGSLLVPPGQHEKAREVLTVVREQIANSSDEGEG